MKRILSLSLAALCLVSVANAAFADAFTDTFITPTPELSDLQAIKLQPFAFNSPVNQQKWNTMNNIVITIQSIITEWVNKGEINEYKTSDVTFALQKFVQSANLYFYYLKKSGGASNSDYTKFAASELQELRARYQELANVLQS